MNKKGFTLIELMVVVLIIAILAAVALPQYQKSIEKARATDAWTTLKAIEDAVKRYELKKGISSVIKNDSYKKGCLVSPSNPVENSELDIKFENSQYFNYFVCTATGSGRAYADRVDGNNNTLYSLTIIDNKMMCADGEISPAGNCEEYLGFKTRAISPVGSDYIQCLSASDCWLN